MPGPGPHIIKKQIIEVSSFGLEDGFSLQEETERICKQQLIPQLEALLDRLNTKERLIIDELFIEVGADSLGDLEESLTEKVLSKIEAELLEKIPFGIKSRPIDLFVFYMRQGYLPWWSSVQDTSAWKNFLEGLISSETSDADWSVLKGAFWERIVRERTLSALSEEQCWNLLQCLSPSQAASLKSISIEVKNYLSHAPLAQRFDQAFKHQILKSLHKSPGHLPWQEIVEDALLPVLKALPLSAISLLDTSNLGDRTIKTSLESIQRKSLSAADTLTDSAPNRRKQEDLPSSTSEASQRDPDEIYLSDAGLVIIAAYLPLFFKNVQVLEKDEILDIPKAVSLLHYLVYGASDYSEFECVLPKILCGVDVAAVVQVSEITGSEKEKVNEVLLAVIEHWQALKTTSVDGLRTSFLQRGGSLSFVDDAWRLTVQNESYDLLISFLPWNISMIKLPWMKHLLKVDWQN